MNNEKENIPNGGASSLIEENYNSSVQNDVKKIYSIDYYDSISSIVPKDNSTRLKPSSMELLDASYKYNDYEFYVKNNKIFVKDELNNTENEITGITGSIVSMGVSGNEDPDELFALTEEDNIFVSGDFKHFEKLDLNTLSNEKIIGLAIWTDPLQCYGPCGRFSKVVVVTENRVYEIDEKQLSEVIVAPYTVVNFEIGFDNNAYPYFRNYSNEFSQILDLQNKSVKIDKVIVINDGGAFLLIGSDSKLYYIDNMGQLNLYNNKTVKSVNQSLAADAYWAKKGSVALQSINIVFEDGSEIEYKLQEYLDTDKLFYVPKLK